MKKSSFIVIVCMLCAGIMCGCQEGKQEESRQVKKVVETTQNSQTKKNNEVSKTISENNEKSKNEVAVLEVENVENIFVYHGKETKKLSIEEALSQQIIQETNEFLMNEKYGFGIADCNLIRGGNGNDLELQEDAYCVEICLKEPTNIQYAGLEGMEQYKNVLSVQIDSTEDMICLSTQKAKENQKIVYGAIMGESIAKDIPVTKEIIDIVRN